MLMLNNQPDTLSGINHLRLPILREKSAAIFFRIAAANPHFPITSRLSRKTLPLSGSYASLPEIDGVSIRKPGFVGADTRICPV
jgi:hypothetical protein